VRIALAAVFLGFAAQLALFYEGNWLATPSDVLAGRPRVLFRSGFFGRYLTVTGNLIEAPAAEEDLADPDDAGTDRSVPEAPPPRRKGGGYGVISDAASDSIAIAVYFPAGVAVPTPADGVRLSGRVLGLPEGAIDEISLVSLKAGSPCLLVGARRFRSIQLYTAAALAAWGLYSLCLVARRVARITPAGDPGRP
jgi:hypothetical protein